MGMFNFFKRQKSAEVKKEAQSVPAAPSRAEESAFVNESVPAAPEKAVRAEQPSASEKAAEPARTKSSEADAPLKTRYNYSFTAKLIRSDDSVKRYYGEIKNELTRYKVKARTSWHYETFKKGRKLLAKISFRGKTLCLYFALDPAAYEGTKYKAEDVSSVTKNADVPLLYRLKNDRRSKYAKDLIAAVMERNGLEAGESAFEDYVSRYPYEEIEPLIGRGLIKLSKSRANAVTEEQENLYKEIAAAEYIEKVESITVSEAEEKIEDSRVETFIRESERKADRTKRDIVNIDALGRYFNGGDRVTIEDIKKRVPGVNKKATYIKVLARGILDKALDVEADDFSPAAVKMIVLTGGSVTRTRK